MEFLTRKQAAEKLGISLTTLDELRRQNKIGYLQRGPGCKVQFTQAHIQKYLRQLDKDAPCEGIKVLVVKHKKKRT